MIGVLVPRRGRQRLLVDAVLAAGVALLLLPVALQLVPRGALDPGVEVLLLATVVLLHAALALRRVWLVPSFVRLALTGGLEVLPGEPTDVAAWLPELFWPLWSAGLALATWTYWRRRRAACRSC